MQYFRVLSYVHLENAGDFSLIRTTRIRIFPETNLCFHLIVVILKKVRQVELVFLQVFHNESPKKIVFQIH